MGDSNGRTALMNASRLGNVKIVTILLEKGAIVSLKDSAGRTALSEAYKESDKSSIHGREYYKEIIQLLKRAAEFE